MVINKNALWWSVIIVINFQFCSKAATGWQRSRARPVFVSSRVHISISCFINSIPTKGSFWIAQSSCHKALAHMKTPSLIIITLPSLFRDSDTNIYPGWEHSDKIISPVLRDWGWPGSWSEGAGRSGRWACPGTGHSTGRGRAQGRRVSASSGL